MHISNSPMRQNSRDSVKKVTFPYIPYSKLKAESIVDGLNRGLSLQMVLKNKKYFKKLKKKKHTHKRHGMLQYKIRDAELN